jgi:hypothetical protein
MPYIETPEELVDDLADLFGVYGAHTEGTDCPDDPRKMCRVCFIHHIAARVRRSVKNEADLKTMSDKT